MLSNTRSDSLRLYLTGASSDGGTQSNPDLSLGHYRSSTIAGSAPFIPPNLHNILVLYVSQANPPGLGNLTARDENSLSWCAPGDDSGAPQSVASGETVLLESASSPDQFILVQRTSGDDLAGSATLEVLGETFNDVIGQANATLPVSDVTYRGLILKNGPGQTITNLQISANLCDNPVQFASETPSSQPSGHIQTIADETTAPTGLTFFASPAVVTVPLLRPSEQVGLWLALDRTSASAIAAAATRIQWTYTAVG